MNKKELWLSIKNYHFDHLASANIWGKISEVFGGVNANTKAFAAKIARKHGWKNKFALMAVQEYKKFVYLGIVSDFHVTPSKIIDTVWHEHLLFTKAYREFCKQVIACDFDHHPELLPVDSETDIFHAQYNDTLDLYRSEFGKEPVTAVWQQTKYQKENPEKINALSRKKITQTDYNGNTDYSNALPLYTFFDNPDGTNDVFAGFDNGDFDGGGAGGDFGDSADGGCDGGDGGGCSSGCGGGD